LPDLRETFHRGARKSPARSETMPGSRFCTRIRKAQRLSSSTGTRTWSRSTIVNLRPRNESQGPLGSCRLLI
jgi:hypothetical protein